MSNFNLSSIIDKLKVYSICSIIGIENAISLTASNEKMIISGKEAFNICQFIKNLRIENKKQDYLVISDIKYELESNLDENIFVMKDFDNNKIVIGYSRFYTIICKFIFTDLNDDIYNKGLFEITNILDEFKFRNL